MKIKFIYLYLIFGTFLMLSCSKNETTQQVIMLSGNFSHHKDAAEIVLNDGKRSLSISTASIISGAVLYADSLNTNYQATILLKNDTELATKLKDFLKGGEGLSQRTFSSNIFDNPPPCPPQLVGSGECPPKVKTQMQTLEINTQTPIEIQTLPSITK